MSSPERANNRRGTLGVRRLELLVSSRDVEILRCLREFRLLTTIQLRDLYFASHASEISGTRVCQSVLQRLSRLRLVKSLGQTRGGNRHGSTPIVWTLDVAGERLLRHLAGESSTKKFHPLDATHPFYAHTLAVSDAVVSIVTASRQGRFELLSLIGEPRNWKSFPGEVGGVRIVRPDLSLVTAQGDYEYLWYIEIDRGTESTTTLIRKCHIYQDYKRSGAPERQLGTFPKVVWVLPTQRRGELLREALHRERGIDPDLFAMTTPEQLINVIAGSGAPQQEKTP